MASVTYDKATRLYPGGNRPAVDSLDLDVADLELSGFASVAAARARRVFVATVTATVSRPGAIVIGPVIALARGVRPGSGIGGPGAGIGGIVARAGPAGSAPVVARSLALRPAVARRHGDGPLRARLNGPALAASVMPPAIRQ